VCNLTSRRDSEYEFEAEMGKGTVEQELTLTIRSGDVRGVPVSMGNPHFVIFVPEFARNWREQAVEIQKLANFPEGVNVEYVVVDSKFDLRARFYERGAGETRSSGTGSCACALAAMATGRADSPVKVHAPGGAQTVRRVGENIFLRGPARLVCRGEFFLD
jgi:diaminopimelate epimerase